VSLSPEAQNLNWLISGFVDRAPGVTHAVVVSADGLLVAMSQGLTRESADHLAALSSSLVSIVIGAAQVFEGDEVRQTVVEMGRRFYIVMSIKDGSILAALANQGCDVGLVAYEMAKLTKQAGELLTPALRSELQDALPR
jgi:predicted regulator of Ras-like GTPase activity (Roadblock/LC7/MglB family)